MQFDFYVLKSCDRNVSKDGDSTNAARNDHMKFSMPGFKSHVFISVDKIPSFTRGIIVELIWSSEADQWELIRFWNDKNVANTLPTVV